MSRSTSSPTLLPTLLTVAEAAQHLRVSVRTVRRLIASNELPARRVKRSVRVSAVDLRNYLMGAQ